MGNGLALQETKMNLFKLTVTTPVKQVFDAEVESVVAPGMDGQFGVLAHHAHMIAPIQSGVFVVRGPEGEKLIAACNGFFEVKPEGCVLTVESASVVSNRSEAEDFLEAEQIQKDLLSSILQKRTK